MNANNSIATIGGFKITSEKDKITLTFEGKSEDLVSKDKRSLPEAMKELSSSAYLNLSVTVGVDSFITPLQAEEEAEEMKGKEADPA